MKRYILFLLILFPLFSCNTAVKGPDKDKVETAASDSSKIKTDAKGIIPSSESLKMYFNERKASNQVLVQPKNIAANGNGIYCYFTLSGNKATALRFRIQYWDEKYADVDQYQFVVDGKKYDYIANRDESGSHNTRIVDSSTTFYWYDDRVDKTDQNFLEAMARSKSAKLNLIDRAVNKVIGTIEITENQKSDIKRTLDYYFSLNGAAIPKKGMVNIRS
ncbi:MAG: hypothetical protein ACLVKO_02505 [Dysgonomonas sp.]